MEYKLIIDPQAEEAVVITAHAPSALTQQIQELVAQYTDDQRLWGFREDEMRPLQVEEIECITVLDGKTYAIDGSNHRYRLKQRLYLLEESLPGYFIRINKSTLANERKLDRFVTSFSGAVDAIFQCGYREYVSRRCLSQIRRRYQK